MPNNLTEAEKAEIWERRRGGQSLQAVARQMGKGFEVVRLYVVAAGGVQRPPRRRPVRGLSVMEREEISRGLAGGLSCRAIAAQVGRAASTVSREVKHNRGRDRYRAGDAEAACFRRRRRPKLSKLGASPRLRAEVEMRLMQHWSPEQIAGWLKLVHPGDAQMQVSHETIYLSLFVQSRGALRRELARHLRTRRLMRGVQRKKLPTVAGLIPDKVLISERPAEVADRSVPGHWEGDLVFGTKTNAIGTLVERSTRYVMLFRLPDGMKAEQVRRALTASILRLPQHLHRSLTWDQGIEMAQHAQFTVDTGVAVYFCDPRSPWQRGSNENTNGLLRQYFPKGESLANVTQERLDAVAAELNGLPRQTLGWFTPAQKLAELTTIAVNDDSPSGALIT